MRGETRRRALAWLAPLAVAGWLVIGAGTASAAVPMTTGVTVADVQAAVDEYASDCGDAFSALTVTTEQALYLQAGDSYANAMGGQTTWPADCPDLYAEYDTTTGSWSYATADDADAIEEALDDGAADLVNETPPYTGSDGHGGTLQADGSEGEYEAIADGEAEAGSGILDAVPGFLADAGALSLPGALLGGAAVLGWDIGTDIRGTVDSFLGIDSTTRAAACVGDCSIGVSGNGWVYAPAGTQLSPQGIWLGTDGGEPGCSNGRQASCWSNSTHYGPPSTWAVTPTPGYVAVNTSTGDSSGNGDAVAWGAAILESDWPYCGESTAGPHGLATTITVYGSYCGNQTFAATIGWEAVHGTGLYSTDPSGGADTYRSTPTAPTSTPTAINDRTTAPLTIDLVSGFTTAPPAPHVEPGTGGAELTIPTPGDGELWADYDDELVTEGFTDVSENVLTDADTDTSVGPNAVAAVEPAPGTQVTAATAVEVSVNPADAPTPGAGGGGFIPAPTLPGIELPNLSPGCHVFPFGIPCWLVGLLGDLNASPVAPHVDWPLSPYGTIDVNLGTAWGGAIDTLMVYVRALFEISSLVYLVIWLARTLGYGAAADGAAADVTSEESYG